MNQVIPTLDDILAGLHAGTYTVQQAKPWVAQHIQSAVAEGRTRDLFAAAALEGKLATGMKPATPDALAVECWSYADAMVACCPEVVS